MIAYSDNTATNLLVREVGAAATDRRMESYGLKDTKIFRPTFRDGHADVYPELEKEFGLGMITPREAARLMALVVEGKVVSRAACDEMLAMLGNQFDRQMIPRSLPFEKEKIFVANKTGWDEEKLPDASGLKGEIRTDAAYVKGPKSRYAIAICTRRGKDKRPGADNAALVTGAAISRLVYDEMERRAESAESGPADRTISCDSGPRGMRVPESDARAAALRFLREPPARTDLIPKAPRTSSRRPSSG